MTGAMFKIFHKKEYFTKGYVIKGLWKWKFILTAAVDGKGWQH